MCDKACLPELKNTGNKKETNNVSAGTNEVLLTQSDTLRMGKYLVTYIGKRQEGINIYFDAISIFTRYSPNIKH